MVSMNCQNNQQLSFKGSYPYATTRGLNKITKELEASNISYKVLENKVVTGKDLVSYIKETKKQVQSSLHNSIESFEEGLKKAVESFKRGNKKG